MIKRILVGISDETYTVASTRHAIELANRNGATLTGVSILDVARLRKETVQIPLVGGGDTTGKAKVFEDAHESIDAAVGEFVRLCEEAEVRFDVDNIAGDPFLEFVERSKYHDLVVCGLRRLFQHGVLPEPKHELAKLISAGVRPILATASEYRTIRKVLIAYSNSVESAKTMRRFAQLRHLLAPRADVEVVSFGPSGGEAPAALLQAQHYLQAHGIEPEINLMDGTARTGVLNHAGSCGADMLVMGNSAKSLLRKQVFGETAIHTITNAQLPLFLSQ